MSKTLFTESTGLEKKGYFKSYPVLTLFKIITDLKLVHVLEYRGSLGVGAVGLACGKFQ
jgi:hypothetical protein